MVEAVVMEEAAAAEMVAAGTAGTEVEAVVMEADT